MIYFFVNAKRQQITIMITIVYLVFPTAHCQREKLMEETLLLRIADSHMTSEHAVQSCTVSDGQKKTKDKD